VNQPQIAIFARSAKEDTPPLRAIEGQGSLLGRTMHDIAFDGIHDEIVVTSPLTQAILSFRGAANGEEPPLRVIQGDKTLIKGVGATGKVSIDPVHNEIYLATPDQQILVFNRTDNGNVAPKRILSGPNTMLSLGKQNTDPNVMANTAGGVYGGGNVPCIRIDPVHNLLLVPRQTPNGGGLSGSILIFDRTASGDTPPKAIIQGPVRMGNQFEVYPPAMTLISHAGTDFEIWKIPTSGTSTEKPLKISAPLGRQSGDIGLAIDPLHKEVIVATAAGNSVETFYVPEAFDANAAATSSGAATPGQ
jgi:hypothetical protein